MRVEALSVDGAWLVEPVLHADDRGVFLESFRGDVLAEVTGRPFHVVQANTSVSAAGVVRGVHFAQVPPSQAKYVTCARGAVLDVVVDIRTDSPTFGSWTSVLLDDTSRRAVLLSEGLGHAFMSLVDGSTVTYLVTAPYAPGREHGIHPFDPAVGIQWPTVAPDGTPLVPSLSDKDAAAPTLAEARAAGLLPTLAEVDQHLKSLAPLP
ncbi:dTDP-4-dehydrorhamnose 3,5-epimerase family protein [Cellulomonas sp. zg-ZUI222]|uniref:dTDP-4-dehydrorhamnose 3,5-epimerase family protein n=1 Tax=Cellulomonas TaxID=1707 RepID=UPI001A9441A9|nr:MULTISPECIES: dTDP-4-dehydrorhamnose 3,5-epimerase [Cellulomonas]MBO0901949.1 dTDP-4-dehydrorhamnose 3,5-epimerase family protein [Cellulomonas sp. zg-ZUI22]MBO0922805.1 dTDP-4-dehydrorhamnose 3,5-epimerase family protein [Cellulomonas wangleii]